MKTFEYYVNQKFHSCLVDCRQEGAQNLGANSEKDQIDNPESKAN